MAVTAVKPILMISHSTRDILKSHRIGSSRAFSFSRSASAALLAATFLVPVEIALPRSTDRSSPVKARRVLTLAATPSGAATAVQTKFEGSFDKLVVESIGGWAWDGDRPNEAIKIEIYDGVNLLATVTASEFREDLKNAGKGDGKHAFNYALPPTLRDGKAHTISVRFAGSPTELPGSPKTLLFPKP
jgi:hypothetical protein